VTDLTDAAHAVLTADEMAEMDRRAIASGVSSLDLMEAAGTAVADVACEMLGGSGTVRVACGPGNNGGDGYVAARILVDRGYAVDVVSLVPRDTLKGDAAAMARRWTGPIATPAECPELLAPDLIIDAVFGAGLSRGFDDDTQSALNLMFGGRGLDGAPPKILAVDVPSGLDATTGQILSSVQPADRTVTFFRKKRGHLLFPGRPICGRLTVHDIGIPESVLGGSWKTVETSPPPAIIASLSHGFADTHKYKRGHAIVLSGPAHATGAARLAARAALRGGAGLVTVAAFGDDAVMVNAAHLTAIMVAPIATPDDFARQIERRRATVAIIGPGAGISERTRACVEAAREAGCRLLLDADALSVFADDPDALFRLLETPDSAECAVLTPHAGEFKRLFPDITGSKLEKAREAARRSGAVVVLKGADTVIASENGRAAINANAPPTLATAGSGDVLCGLIAAGMASTYQGAWEAACHGVWLHGACAARFGPGLIAEDIVEMLPDVLATLGTDSRG
jgi:hydroxyethylthiazole kinase-like uncharacterized protein yjeF